MVQGAYPYALSAIDLLLLISLFALLCFLRHNAGIEQIFSRRIFAAIAVPSLLGNYLIGAYNYRTRKNSSRFISEHLIVSAGVNVLIFTLVYAFVSYGNQLHSSRVVIFGTAGGFALLSMVYRMILGIIQSYFERHNVICLIGVNQNTLDLIKRLRRDHFSHRFVVLSHDDTLVGKRLNSDSEDPLVIKSLEHMRFDSSIGGRYVESYILMEELDAMPEELRRNLIVSLFNRNPIYSYESFVTDKLGITPPTEISLDWALQPGFFLLRGAAYPRLKRIGDILASLIGLIIASPLLIGAALAVRITSRGPIIFKQKRTGMHERPFDIYKFRSMKVGSEKGAKYTAKNDARFTPIGKFIRKTRIDELPQLFNILKGDLSLIGPRAEWVDLVAIYEKKFPCYHFRHSVRPGVTGWAQVNYSYGASEEDTLEKLAYDLYYIKHSSFVLDLSIIIKTVYTVLFGRGQ